MPSVIDLLEDMQKHKGIFVYLKPHVESIIKDTIRLTNVIYKDGKCRTDDDIYLI